MWLKSLTLKNFRNYEDIAVSFHDGLNVFLGQNAQGKTNILESIYFLALTRSHRTRSDKDLIHFTSQTVKVSGELAKQTTTLPLDIELTQKGRITKVNHLKQTKLSNYIGHMNVVLFAPEDLQLVKGAPALRRKFIDMELGQIKPLYLSDLSQYNHILKQRNAYLKSTEKIDETFLEVLDQQLTEFGCRVMRHRIDFLKKLEHFAQAKHRDISNHLELLTIRYLSSVSHEPVNLEETFQTALKQSRKRDLFKKNTGVGPHRDDIAFYINDMDVNFGSQGQHRSVVLSLKLAEIELMESITREKPILLLDDVMSELDNSRQLSLLKTISQNIQTFITTTTLEHLKNLPEDLKIFTIKAGNIEEKD
ncbi:DNA replication/repair protein RecF [Streptococcus himalayensis]|uniref:DNA replication and repair protein RecF n=1 Tax=Streptococcus himalayensis TaxID=1888195 RepID=A0A917EEG2_9STRE|nr:DNA replication/repair protein RecF [Streptococcus himalayensis]GGE23935.1 DNA replication and repair protein RecF [Streptococcus himalayensis]